MKAFIDGRRVGSTSSMTWHRRYDFAFELPLGRGKHKLTLVWYRGGTVVARTTRTVG